MENKDLQAKYDEMHSHGPSAWFSDGQEERELILKMGEPWEGETVLEIGCGEGELGNMMFLAGAQVFGVDYSQVAIDKASEKYPGITFWEADYHSVDWVVHPDRLVLQGILEHLDDPFTELKWMMDNLLTDKGDVITSSPCFLNPRGIVWMTLDMLGAVMSKTDLHYLNPKDFSAFCQKYGYEYSWDHCDQDWAVGKQMIDDLRIRIPLSLKDRNIPFDENKIEKFLKWLDESRLNMANNYGATAAYRISK